MNEVNATLNVLAFLITSGEVTGSLVEYLEMRRVVDDPRKMSLFDNEVGPRVFVETKAFLECSWDDLFLSSDVAFKRILNWIRVNGAKDSTLSCSMSSDASTVAYKLHSTLEDRSELRIRMEFGMSDPKHPEFRKCDLRLRRSNSDHFIAPVRIEGDMSQAPIAFLQCIRECVEYEKIQVLARDIMDNGFVGHVCKLPSREGAWGEETFLEQNDRGENVLQTVRIATYGEERYEYEVNERGEERATLRCGKYFKCLFRRKLGTDDRLRAIVFKGKRFSAEAREAKASVAVEAEEQSAKSAASAENATSQVPTKTAPLQGARKETDPKPAPVKKDVEPATYRAPQSAYRRIELDSKDVLVRLENSNYEAHQHPTERVEVVVEVKQTFGRAKRIPVTAYHCERCGNYLISQFAYNTLKGDSDRFICCRVVDENDVDAGGNAAKCGSGERYLAEESLLHSYGYNVGRKDSLTPAQRRMILEFVVSEGIMTPERAMGFLQYLIDRAKSRRKADMSNAIHSWETDVRYLKDLEKKR